MGINQERKEVEELSLSNEGINIENISKTSLDQNIYVCGNYDIDFFQNNIIQEFRLPAKSHVKYYVKMGKHKEIKDWHFFFAPKNKDFSEIKENLKKFLEEHNGYKEFDDFNEGIKDRIGKIVILYFNDECKDNFFNYFIKEHNQFKLPLFVIVGIESENNQIKEKILGLIKEALKEKVDRKIDKNIFKFTEFSKDKEKNLINLNFNLIECSAFYNELGDEFKYPKQLINDKLFDKVIEDIVKDFSTLNILICGRAGVGKSTFINGMLNTTISRSQKGDECTQRIIKYIHRKLPITFYDTPGMSTVEKMTNIINLIKKKNKDLGEIQSKIHAVFYILNGADTRFFYEFENKMFELLLKEYKIPLYFLITRINEEQLKENKEIIIKNYYNVTKTFENSVDEEYTKEKIGDNIFCINMIGESFSETHKLFDKMYKDFRKYIKPEKFTKSNLREMTSNDCLIPLLNKPQAIVFHQVKLCQHINLTYRLIARSISSKDKGSTLLDECRSIINSMDFQLDKKDAILTKEYKHWFPGYFGYKTPAEEEISYIAYKYIKKFSGDLGKNDETCLEYINKLRESINSAIEGLNSISNEYNNKSSKEK